MKLKCGIQSVIQGLLLHKKNKPLANSSKRIRD